MKLVALFKVVKKFQLYKSMSEIPYTAKTPWFIHVMCSPLILSWIYFIFISPSLLVESWQLGNWFGRFALIFFFTVLPLCTLSVFLTKTKFDHNGIEHRDFLGVTKLRSYQDIVETKGFEEHIKITFSDNTSIKIWMGEANIGRVLRIMKKKREQ